MDYTPTTSLPPVACKSQIINRRLTLCRCKIPKARLITLSARLRGEREGVRWVG
jgi:hypothetical protein